MSKENQLNSQWHNESPPPFSGFLLRTNLEKDDECADKDADALQQISHYVDEGCSHTGIGLLGSFSFKNKSFL